MTVMSAPPTIHETEDRLGPLIATQKATHAIAWIAIALGGLMLPLSLTLAVVPPPRKTEPSIEVAIMFAVVSAAALAVLVYGIRKRYVDRDFCLFLHENGLRKRHNGRDTVILFDDADTIAFDTVRLFVNGVYAGTNEFLGLKQGDTATYFFRQVKEPNPREDDRERGQVDRLAAHASARIAGKMAEALLRGEQVEWTDQFRLSANALDIAPVPWFRGDLRDLFRHRQWQRVEIPDVESDEIDRGVYRLWLRGDERPRVALRTNAPNFHPGLLVFHALAGEGRRGLERVRHEGGV